MNLYNTQIHPQVGPALSATTWVSSPVVGATTTFSISVTRARMPVSNAVVTVRVRNAADVTVFPITSVPVNTTILGSYSLTPVSRSIFTVAGASYRIDWVVTVPAAGTDPELVLPLSQQVEALSNNFAGQMFSPQTTTETTAGLRLAKSGFPSTLSVSSVAQIGLSEYAAAFDHIHGSPPTWPVTVKINGSTIGSQSILNFLTGATATNNTATNAIDISISGGSGGSGSSGSLSVKVITLKGTTINASTVRLTTDNAGNVTSQNVPMFSSITTYDCNILVLCTQANSATSSASWDFSILARKGTTNASTTIIGNSFAKIICDASLSELSIIIREDTGLGALDITCNGYSTYGTLNWLAIVTMTEVM